MNSYTSRRVVAALAVTAIAATPAAAFASSPSPAAKKKATAYCKAQEKKLGKTKFDKKYKSMGKCISAYEKKHK